MARHALAALVALALLSALVTTRADSVVATMPSGAKPEASVVLTFDEGKQERVTFYRAGDEAYASRDGLLAKIQGSVLDEILKAIPQ